MNYPLALIALHNYSNARPGGSRNANFANMNEPGIGLCLAGTVFWAWMVGVTIYASRR